MTTPLIIILIIVDQMRQYFTQLRQEMGQRLIEKVFYPDDKPSKVMGVVYIGVVTRE